MLRTKKVLPIKQVVSRHCRSRTKGDFTVVWNICNNIKLVFLPENTNAKLQPCDVGIIQAVKLRYRTRLLRRIVLAIDKVESASSLAKKVTLFDAIIWLGHAWDQVAEDTIKKCFANCGISCSILRYEIRALKHYIVFALLFVDFFLL